MKLREEKKEKLWEVKRRKTRWRRSSIERSSRSPGGVEMHTAGSRFMLRHDQR
ncbi:conserved hypothetical protein [Culex quinquefasciatus]|uniref:Uncharacterized protein n=1 Tax=Culex quinquefasciatus TaxID=7176 RepID=B0X988_CULQU|nr:conserved hypothetical protein [Culex quinquefasciatus]|eukprot:XP_001866210.1 conserved hypothetical protein [Culex quinquefasciatus]